MFRESDYQPPKLHSSYAAKPLSKMQLHSQLSKFENPNNDEVSRQQLPQDVVPTTFDTVYDPAHPDADWSGRVSKAHNQKKHSTNHRSQMSGIIQSEYGLLSTEDKKEWTSLRRGGANNSNSNIIGGISCEGEHFQTTIQRQNIGETTGIDQLSLSKRHGNKKNLPDPALMHQEYQNIQENKHNSYHETAAVPQQSSGYYNTSKSFISNIGSSLVNRVPNTPSNSNNNNAVAIRPEARKELVIDNYRNIPGKMEQLYITCVRVPYYCL